MSYLPYDPQFNHGFYNMYNPNLWDTLAETHRMKQKLRKEIGDGYEIRENGVALLGNYADEAQKAGEEENTRDKLLFKYGSGIKYYKTADELIERMEILYGSMQAGNKSMQLKNEALNIIDRLFNDGDITKQEYFKLCDLFI